MFLAFAHRAFAAFRAVRAALFIGHGFQTALPADPPSLGPDLPHDLLDDGEFHGFRQGYGFQGNAAARQGAETSNIQMTHLPTVLSGRR